MSGPGPQRRPAVLRSSGGSTASPGLRTEGETPLRSARKPRRRREGTAGSGESNAFSAECIAYSGDPREADALREAGEILMAGRGEAKLPPVEPRTAARVRASTLGAECGALADWCGNADLVGDLLAMEEPTAAYLYHRMERAGWRLRAIHGELCDAFTDLDARARAWAQGYRQPATAAGGAIAPLLLLLDLRQAFGEVRRVVRIGAVPRGEGSADPPEATLLGLVEGAEEALRRAVEDLHAAYALAEGLEEA